MKKLTREQKATRFHNLMLDTLNSADFMSAAWDSFPSQEGAIMVNDWNYNDGSITVQIGEKGPEFKITIEEV